LRCPLAKPGTSSFKTAPVAIEFQDIELHDAVDRGDQDLPPPQCQRLVRRLKIGIADGIEHDVGALAVRQLANARRDISRGGVDHVNPGIGVTLVGLACAHHTDHARAVPARDLHRGLPDLAVNAHHQHRLVLAWHAGAAKAFHRRDKGNADPGGLIPRQVFRFFHDSIGFNREMRGMGAVAPDAEIARRAEHVAPDPIGWAIDHDARVIATGRARKYGVSHQAGRGLDVGRIHGRRRDFDQHLVRGPRQRAPLDRRRQRCRIVSLRQQAQAARLDHNRLTMVFFGSWRHGCSDFWSDFRTRFDACRDR